MRYSKLIGLTTLLFFCLPFAISAHGLGQTITIEADDYEIGVNLDTLNPKVGQTIRFDFELLDSGLIGLPTDFDYVWVRLQKGQKVIFAGGIGKPDFGPTGFSTVLPDSGVYTIHVRFQNEGEKIVEGSGNLDIASGRSEGDSFFSFLFTTQFFIGLIVGLVLGFLLPSFFKK